MTDLTSAIRSICEEKGLSYEAVVGTIESALAAAYRKDFGQKNQNIKVEFKPETGKSKVFDVKTVVEDLPEEEEEDGREDDKKEKAEKIKPKKGGKEKEDKDKEEPKSENEEEERKFNPKTDMQISDAKLIKKTAKIDDEIKIKLEVPDEYGRMAAQTAKQVIIQRLREAEREMIFNEFKDKEKEVISGVVQRRENRFVLVDVGKTVGYLSNEEQIYGEKYNPGERIKVYIKEVRLGAKGAEVILSRTSDEILKKIFYLEIPEISNGLVELKAVAREAGSRAKVAVWTDSDNVDPIGSCVGQRGARIQTIINELGGEKVDIIEYDEDPPKFIANALSPAKILSVEIDEKENKAIVKVTPDQLSLAIGKNGQNARLAARLTGWRIDIVGDEKSEKAEEGEKGKKGKDEKKKDPVKSAPSDAKALAGKKADNGASEKKKDKKEDDKKKDSDKKKEKAGKKDKEKDEKSKKDTKKEDKKSSSPADSAGAEDKEEKKETKKKKDNKAPTSAKATADKDKKKADKEEK